MATGARGVLTTPGSLVVDANGRVLASSPTAEPWLAEVDDSGCASGWSGMLAVLVRAALTGATPERATCRIPTRSGWAVVRACRLESSGGGPAPVLVTLGEATPRDTVPLLLEALYLTPRERQVVELSLRGLDTRAICDAMALSAFTVQDHFRAIFDKAGVHSRGELLGRLVLGRCSRDDPVVDEPVASAAD